MLTQEVLFIIVAVCFVLLLLLVYFWQKQRFARLLAQYETQHTYILEEKNVLETRLMGQDKRLLETQELYQQERLLRVQAESSLSELKKIIASQESFRETQVLLIKEQEKQLMSYFSNISHELMNQQRSILNKENSEQLTHLLTPFKDNLEGFQRQIQSMRVEQAKQKGEFSEQMRQVMDNNQLLSQQADNLTKALMSNKKKQGNWGEMVLMKLLESCGLQKGIHFETQVGFHVEHTQGEQHKTSTVIPDVVVKLPEDKQIVIDSKVSLGAYMDAMSADNDEDYQIAIKSCYEHVKKHIQSLSGKSYHAIPKLDSPNFVLMFIPLEGVYFTLLQTYPSLYQEAFDMGVILVSHTTLMPILRTVSNVWVLASRQDEMACLIKQSEGIYQKAVAMRESIDKLGKGLESSVNAYNKLVGQFSGKNSLVRQLDKFKSVQIKETKVLDKSVKLVTTHVRVDHQAS